MITLFSIKGVMFLIASFVAYRCIYQCFIVRNGQEVQIGEDEETTVMGGNNIRSVTHRRFKEEKEKFPQNEVDMVHDDDIGMVSSENKKNITHYWFFEKKK